MGDKMIRWGNLTVLSNRLIISAILALASFYPVVLAPFQSQCQWDLTFKDNFDASEINNHFWNTSYPSGVGELQDYAPDAFRIQNGILKIKAEKRSMNGRHYTSGVLTTKGKFEQEYGYFEVRAEVPKGRGLFPAFWLMPASGRWPPEIDVFETLGHGMDRVYLSNHWERASGEHLVNTQFYQGPDFSSGYHRFAIEWTQSNITWYVDGVQRFSTDTGVPNEPMFLIVNLAVGGIWPGPPDHTTGFPGYLKVDYVKVYQQNCSFFSHD